MKCDFHVISIFVVVMQAQTIMEPTISDRTMNFDETIEVFLVRLGLVLSNAIDFVPYGIDEMLPEPIFQPHRLLNLFVVFSSVNGACK